MQSSEEENTAEDGVWTLYDGSDQVRAGFSWEDMRMLCREHRVFPELLFFESQGPTARDIRLREHHKRIKSSDLMFASERLARESYVANHTTVGFESSVLRRSPSNPTIRGYGTIDQESASSVPSPSSDAYALDELEPNWCNGPCAIQ